MDLGLVDGTLACDGCSYDTIGCLDAAPVLSLGFSQVKRFDFSWAAVPDAEYYQVLESPAPGDPYVQLGGDVVGESVSFEMPLHFRWQASYVLRACNGAGCTDSAVVDVVGSLAEAVGYVKASNTGSDTLGYRVVLSGDGSTPAVGAPEEDSNATGVSDEPGGDTARRQRAPTHLASLRPAPARPNPYARVDRPPPRDATLPRPSPP